MTDTPPPEATAAGLTHAAVTAREAMDSLNRLLVPLKNTIKGTGTLERSHYDTVNNAANSLLAIINILTANGAANPWDGSHRGDASLSDLATFDTAESRELLDLLTKAQAVAEKVDAQRGNVLPYHIPTGAFESRGTDYAESISNLTIRLNMEICPPNGRD